ncbi:MAG: hypothetical protein M3371_01885 [Acidobacteriota bacterium]|nr:hypothetical protein [Acidobacteriota bacterium]
MPSDLYVRQMEAQAISAAPARPQASPVKCACAVLVKCVRVEGKPRQKVVCYLGHIKERDIGSPARLARLLHGRSITFRASSFYRVHRHCFRF